MLTAERNVELPLLLTNLSKAERRKRAAIALKVVGLADRAKHYPRQLSGGQEQRVGIARAIVTDPTLLLCDEPTGDLDRKAGDEILDLLQTLNREHGKTIVMVTHDPHAAERARRTLHLEKGRAARDGGRMKFLPLIWKNLWRRKVRTTFTLLSIFIAFLLFGMLMTIRDVVLARRRPGRARSPDADPQDQPHHAAARLVPGAACRPCPASRSSTHNTWFGGIYQDPTNFFANIAVEPEPFFEHLPGDPRCRRSR